MFRKLLIANRGEIAVRIAGACTELGIRSVAVYSEPDRFALHVKKANEAHFIGGEPLAGYCDAQRLVELARMTGCDAIHPGYAPPGQEESPRDSELARQCASAGIAFIGPTPEMMASAREADELRRTWRRLGIPVPREEAEALAARLGNPRRVEVQVLADGHGNLVHLYERDCSIQRHGRPMLAVAPCPALTPEQQAYLGELAVRAVGAAGYVSAGSVEFLIKGNEIYATRLNARLQAEHTVNETVTGVDVLREQLRIAAGEKLAYRQQDIRHHGFAIQFRVNAEDPKNDFLPTFGRITRYYAPGGPGVRTDTAIYTGYTLGPHFDALCLKLCVNGLSWEEVLNRGHRALDDLRVQGVKTGAPFYQEILRHTDFRAGRFDTGFLAAHPELLDYSVKRDPQAAALAIAAAIAAYSGL